MCRLKKVLYGLWQAGKSWHQKLDSILKGLGTIPTHADRYVYGIEKGENATFVVVYVDDILNSQSKENIKRLGKELSR